MVSITEGFVAYRGDPTMKCQKGCFATMQCPDHGVALRGVRCASAAALEHLSAARGELQPGVSGRSFV